VIYYGGINFPHRAMVLLALESDAACTILSGNSAIKKIQFWF
jgi:hypothetical protein